MDCSDVIIYETFIKKQSLHLKIFRERWMVLKEKHLYCYKNKKNKTPTEIFDLTVYDTVQEYYNDSEHELFELISSTNANKPNRVFMIDDKIGGFSKKLAWIDNIKYIQNDKKKTQTKWNKLPITPIENYSKPIVFDNENNEFILIFPSSRTSYGFNQGYGFFQYNVTNNKWERYETSPCIYLENSVSKKDKHISVLDKSNNILYLLTDSEIITLNIWSREWKKQIVTHSDWTNINKCGCIVVNHKLHIIGDHKHLIYINDKIVSCTNCAFSYVCNGALFYLEQKEMILLVYIFGPQCSLYGYHIFQEQWHNLSSFKLTTHIYSFCYVLVSKYVILLGGTDISGDSLHHAPDVDDIYVVDIEKLAIGKSTIHCPEKRTYYGCLIHNSAKINLIVNGFIKCNTLIRYLSNDIIMIIQSYYSVEQVHLFPEHCRYTEQSSHWTIPVDEILHNVEPIVQIPEK